LQCRSHPSPHEFPAIREFNREFNDFEALETLFGARNHCAAATYPAIPYSRKQGNYFAEQGFLIQ
jgi:hypothetical protein